MGAYTLLQDLTVASNSTSVVLNDFGTITKDDFIKVLFYHKSTIADTNNVRLFPNGDTNSANYFSQNLDAAGSTIGANRFTSNVFTITPTTSIDNGENFVFSYIKLSENDKFNVFTNRNFDIGDGVRNAFMYMTSTTSFASGITSLTFTSTQTNGIATGTRIQIYKLAAEKVRDIIVETNSTQVDIPTTGTFDPAIDKDSEYLLTWTIESSVTAFVNHNLTPNDLTTLTGYHRQEIAAGGAGASAGRANHARIAETSTTRPFSTGYAHIKLSNIGAYTVQAYDLIGCGTNEPVIANGFISSTAENITSITKLNVIANSTNAIKAGSRFTLYKLYE